MLLDPKIKAMAEDLYEDVKNKYKLKDLRAEIIREKFHEYTYKEITKEIYEDANREIYSFSNEIEKFMEDSIEKTQEIMRECVKCMRERGYFDSYIQNNLSEFFNAHIPGPKGEDKDLRISIIHEQKLEGYNEFRICIEEYDKHCDVFYNRFLCRFQPEDATTICNFEFEFPSSKQSHGEGKNHEEGRCDRLPEPER
jgi:hypothetical protein